MTYDSLGHDRSKKYVEAVPDNGCGTSSHPVQIK